MCIPFVSNLIYKEYVEGVLKLKIRIHYRYFTSWKNSQTQKKLSIRRQKESSPKPGAELFRYEMWKIKQWFAVSRRAEQAGDDFFIWCFSPSSNLKTLMSFWVLIFSLENFELIVVEWSQLTQRNPHSESMTGTSFSNKRANFPKTMYVFPRITPS